jgi:hypothetical protein
MGFISKIMAATLKRGSGLQFQQRNIRSPDEAQMIFCIIFSERYTTR